MHSFHSCVFLAAVISLRLRLKTLVSRVVQLQFAVRVNLVHADDRWAGVLGEKELFGTWHSACGMHLYRECRVFIALAYFALLRFVKVKLKE